MTPLDGATGAPSEQASLSRARTYLESLASKAQLMDWDVQELRYGLEGLCKLELMALKRPLEFGGPQISEAGFREFQEAVALHSGALAFLQTQHQSAVSLLARSPNLPLKQRTLPRMSDGGFLCGIGFSQLRRPGEPIMRASPAGEDFILDGQVPWITGFEFYESFLIGASLSGGEAVFGLVPFQGEEREGGAITFSPPMELAAMNAANTVSAELKGWRLRSEDVLFVREPGWIHTNDQINIALQGFFAVGCARAGLDVVWQAYERRQKHFVLEAHRALTAELEDCRGQMIAAQTLSAEEMTEQKLQLRAWAIDLAARCAHCAVTVSSGAANSVSHPAQRIYREAMVFTVSAQTEPIMAATVERLARRR